MAISLSKTSGSGNDTVQVNAGLHFSPAEYTKTIRVTSGELTKSVLLKSEATHTILNKAHLLPKLGTSADNADISFTDICDLFNGRSVNCYKNSMDHVVIPPSGYIGTMQTLGLTITENTPLPNDVTLRFDLDFADIYGDDIYFFIQFAQNYGMLIMRTGDSEYPFSYSISRNPDGVIKSGSFTTSTLYVEMKIQNSLQQVKTSVVLGINEDSFEETKTNSYTMFSDFMEMFALGNVGGADIYVMNFELRLI